jgi:predicted acylesterase/phospholipase RssA
VVLIRRLEDGVLPLTVVTTDLETGEEVLLEDGPAVPALLASCALPGVFPPVRIGNRCLVDGGTVSDTPVGPAVRAGADRVFVLPSVPAGPMPPPLPAPLVPGVSLFGFDRGPELIEAAYRLTAAWLTEARPVAPPPLAEEARGSAGTANLVGPPAER